MAVFFTSDTHFGHDAIIGLCHRPFTGADEMDETLIARWNEVVGPRDTVYHLGDFCYRNAKAASDYIGRLNGGIHLLAGNHDKMTLAGNASLFQSVNLISEIELGGQWLVLCHYPMREWHRAWRGAWHLFGHVHGRLDGQPLGLSLDAGVDSHNFRPWTFDEIAAEFAERDDIFAFGRRQPAGVSKSQS
jgi:calcineurin-like phosphoesterase family protein